jgi:hypothetical protein
MWVEWHFDETLEEWRRDKDAPDPIAQFHVRPLALVHASFYHLYLRCTWMVKCLIDDIDC